MTKLSTDKSQTNICAIILSYNPAPSSLQYLINGLRRQVDGIVIVDNCSKTLLQDIIQEKFSDLHFLQLEENKGLGAINCGIDFAESLGFSYVILFDQDSLLADNMTRVLYDSFHKLSDSGINIAAIGPCIVDVDSGVEFPFSYLPHHIIRRNVLFSAQTYPAVYCASYLITSGSFIKISTFKKIGHFRGSWFLYHIDTEWCTRAIKQGYQCFGIGDAKLYHRMGEKLRHFKFFGLKIFLPIYPPDRLHNIFRNEVWLIKCGPLSYVWSVMNLCKRVFLYAFFTQPRLSAWKMICMGLKDGLLKKPPAIPASRTNVRP